MEVLAGVGHLRFVVAPDVEDVFGITMDINIPADTSVGIVYVLDVLRLGFALGGVSVICVLRRISGRRILLIAPGAKAALKFHRKS